MHHGTAIREGLENILKAKTGALIIVGDSKEIMDIVDGGFYINEEYTASRLYELAKMDGAIVLSSDMKHILYANAQIIPDSTIPTKETGTRHRTAERTAKQTNELVISISQRRNIITIFKGNFRYVIEDTSKVISKANQALQILEKYKKVLDTKISILNEYEFNDTVTLDNVINCIERIEQVMVIKKASKKLKDWRLFDCELYVTLKPCSICEAIIKQSRIKNVYYLLEKPEIKKEYSKTKFTKTNLCTHEQKYEYILHNFFQKKRDKK